VSTLTLRPNAAGSWQLWSTFGSGSAHYDRVADESDLSGVEITNDNVKRETENLENTPQTGTINHVTAYARAKATGKAKPEGMLIIWRTYSTDYESIKAGVSHTDFTDVSEQRNTNPNTGLAWTWDEINLLQIGCQAQDLDATEKIQVSELWIVVDYTLTTGFRKFQFTSEPPTASAFNQLKFVSEPPVPGAFNKLAYEGE